MFSSRLIAIVAFNRHISIASSRMRVGHKKGTSGIGGNSIGGPGIGDFGGPGGSIGGPNILFSSGGLGKGKDSPSPGRPPKQHSIPRKFIFPASLPAKASKA
jgi:hypothetical protein